MLFQPIVINQISFQRHLKRWMICANEISIIYGVGKRACARARRYDSYFFLRRRCATTDSMAWRGGVWRGKRKNLIYDLFSSYFMLSVSSGRARARILPCGVSHTSMKRRRAFFTDSELVRLSQRSKLWRELSSCSVRAIWLFMRVLARVMLEHIYEYSCRNGRVVRSAEFGEFSSAREDTRVKYFENFPHNDFSLDVFEERQNFYDSIFT